MRSDQETGIDAKLLAYLNYLFVFYCSKAKPFTAWVLVKS